MPGDVTERKRGWTTYGWTGGNIKSLDLIGETTWQKQTKSRPKKGNSRR